MKSEKAMFKKRVFSVIITAAVFVIPFFTVSAEETPTLLHPRLQQTKLVGYGNERNLLMMESYWNVSLDPDEAQMFPSLAENLISLGEANAAAATDTFYQNYEYAKSDFAEGLFSDTEYYTEETTAMIERADSNVFSIRQNYYSYTGGAHGYHYTDGFQFDTKTGQRLSITDVVTDMNALEEVVYNELSWNYPEVFETENIAEALPSYTEEPEKYTWLLGYDRITIFFSPYEIASYAAGELSVELYFNEHEDLINETYRMIPDSYITPFSAGQNLFSDINGDGMTELVKVDINYNEYNEISDLTVQAGDQTLTYDFYCFGVHPYLLHTPDGSFIYLFLDSENDYTYVTVFKITSEGIEHNGEYYPGEMAEFDTSYGYVDEAETVYRWTSTFSTMTDPQKMLLGERLYTLSTVLGYKPLYPDANGTPISDSSYYVIGSPWYFTTKTELVMNRLDENLNMQETIVIPAGMHLRYLRTDAQTWADFALDDGTAVRAEIGFEDAQTICGQILEESLDGVMFAG